MAASKRSLPIECQAAIDQLMSLEPDDIAILSKWNQVIMVLTDHGIAYERTLHVSELFVHPCNRGGLGLNQFNVHANMRTISHIGADISKLIGCACFEMSNDPVTREMQIEFNADLIEQSQGMLAPATGKERYVTVGGGHTAAGCRAVNHGCKSSVVCLSDDLGFFSYEKATKKDKEFKKMLDEGWAFVVIPAFVEELYKSLPKLGQQALNASNNVATETSELETASTIADFAMRMAIEGQEINYDTCVDAARASMPPCEAYIETIGTYVSHFSGGEGAPLIYFLDHVCKSYGAKKKLGQDFFEAITKAVIPSDKTKLPICPYNSHLLQSCIDQDTGWHCPLHSSGTS